MAQVLTSELLAVFVCLAGFLGSSRLCVGQRRGGEEGVVRTLTVTILLAASSGHSNSEEPVEEPHQAAVWTLPPPAFRL